MRKIEARIKPCKLDEGRDALVRVRDALVRVGVEGMTVSEVQEQVPRPRSAWYRGTEYVVSFAPELKIEVVVPDAWVARCIDAIRHAAGSDAETGMIVVLPVDEMIRIRTGERLGRADAVHRLTPEYAPSSAAG